MKVQVFSRLTELGFCKLCTDKLFNSYYQKAGRMQKGKVNTALKVDLIVRMIVLNEK
jgi:hypothetical protein